MNRVEKVISKEITSFGEALEHYTILYQRGNLSKKNALDFMGKGIDTLMERINNFAPRIKQTLGIQASMIYVRAKQDPSYVEGII